MRLALVMKGDTWGSPHRRSSQAKLYVTAGMHDCGNVWGKECVDIQHSVIICTGPAFYGSEAVQRAVSAC